MESKFKFKKQQFIKEDGIWIVVSSFTENYVTILVPLRTIGAQLMEYMEFNFDAIYSGPMVHKENDVYLTFRRK